LRDREWKKESKEFEERSEEPLGRSDALAGQPLFFAHD
jgi:hypothetical protein